MNHNLVIIRMGAFFSCKHLLSFIRQRIQSIFHLGTDRIGIVYTAFILVSVAVFTVYEIESKLDIFLASVLDIKAKSLGCAEHRLQIIINNADPRGSRCAFFNSKLASGKTIIIRKSFFGNGNGAVRSSEIRILNCLCIVKGLKNIHLKSIIVKRRGHGSFICKSRNRQQTQHTNQSKKHYKLLHTFLLVLQ